MRSGAQKELWRPVMLMNMSPADMGGHDVHVQCKSHVWVTCIHADGGINGTPPRGNVYYISPGVFEESLWLIESHDENGNNGFGMKWNEMEGKTSSVSVTKSESLNLFNCLSWLPMEARM